jgi:hypothetical protein
MMRWAFGAALLPFLFCGVMCLGGMALAFFGLRRAAESAPSDHDRDVQQVSGSARDR